MTRAFTAAALAAFAVAGCGHSRVRNEEPASNPVAVVRMNDPAASHQLLRGFYGVENGSWRWTAGLFDALLKVPAGAAQSGATLSLAFSFPDAVSSRVGPVTLSAAVDGHPLNGATYSAPGSYTFSANVPANLLSKDTIRAEFKLDKSLPPSASDRRELGLIATVLSLTNQ